MAISRQRRWSLMGLLISVTSSIVSALIGGSIVWVWQAGHFHLRPAGMSYSDLAAILLTAVAVIVAIFGGVFALAAIWGFAQLKQEAIRAAREAGSSEIREQIANGDIRAYIVDEIVRLANAEFESTRMEDRISRRVDAIAFGRPDADRLLDQDEGEV